MNMDNSSETPQPKVEAKPAAPPPNGVMRYLHDARHTVFGADNAARKALGIIQTGEEPIRQDLQSAVGKERWPALEDHLKKVTPENKQVTSLVQVGDRWIQITTAGNFQPDGGCTFDTTEVDVTETVRVMNERAQIGINKAEKARKSAEDTAVCIAHDVRSPATVIMGYAQILNDGTSLTPEQTTMAREAIIRAATTIGDIAKGYIRLMELESKSGQIELTPLPMGPIIEDLKIQFESQLKEKNGKIDFMQNLPIPKGDALLVQQMLANLISNALKYGGENPQVSVRAVVLPGNQIRFEVQDFGPGIPAEKIPELFQKFKRLQLKEHSGVPGVGLGLAAVKKMAEIQGGTVGVESEVGKGSTFFFTLPAASEEINTQAPIT